MAGSGILAGDERLGTVHDLVIPGLPAADVGTDHARLAVALVASGRCPRVVASDRSQHALRGARRTVATAGLERRVALRCADGFAAFVEGEVATAVLAGMGGRLIGRLIRRDDQSLAAVRRLVLAPNQDTPSVRRALAARGWWLVDERLVESRGHFYWVLAAERDGERGAHSLSPLDEAYGPIARRRRDAVFLRFTALEATRLEACARALTRADTPRAHARRAAIDHAFQLLHMARRREPCTSAS